MSIIDLFSEIGFANHPREDLEVKEKIGGIVDFLAEQGEQVNPFVRKYFGDADLFHSLPEELKSDDSKLAGFMLNMSKFDDVITSERLKRSLGDTSGLLGDEIHIDETTHLDGRVRRAESGYRIDLGYLQAQGIDPSQILFFRVTQSADKPKPEYYWTSDYFETKQGLTREISPGQRKTAIILVASLDVIDKNEGLIQDINDDNGLAVRQIGIDNFDQTLAFTIIHPTLPFPSQTC